MSMRKFGTGEILDADNPADTVQKTASTEDRETVLADVVKEQQQADEEQK